MIDFLRSNTWCSQEQYKWSMTVPQIRLASMDFTHLEYLDTEDNKKANKNKNLENATIIRTAEDIKALSDVGIPII